MQEDNQNKPIPQTSINGSHIPKTSLVQISDRSAPNLMRINADNSSKKALAIYWLLFIGFVVLIGLISLGLPQQFIQKNNETQLHVYLNASGTKCYNPAFIGPDDYIVCKNASESQPYIGIIFRNIVPQNQFVLISAEAYVQDNTYMIDINQTVSINFYSLLERQNIFPNGNTGIVYKYSGHLQKQQFILNINSKSRISTQIRQQDGTIIGYKQFIAYYNGFTSGDYFLSMKLTEPGSVFGQGHNVRQLKLNSFLVNPKFSIFTIVMRAMYFIASITACVLYLWRYRKIPISQRTIQQKLIAVQSILLIFYNDIFYGATILKPNGFLNFYSTFVIVNFLVFLILQWIIFMERILHENGKKDTQLLTWPKFVYIGTIYILSLIVYIWFASYHVYNQPIIPYYDLVRGPLLALQIITFIVILIGYAYILVIFIRCCCQFREKLWRNQLYLVFTIFFIILNLILLFLDGYNIFNYIGRRILYLYSLMNLYTFYLQYMYSITLEESQLIKDNVYNDNLMKNQVESFNDLNENVDINLDQNNYYHSEKKAALKQANLSERQTQKQKSDIQIQKQKNSDDDNFEIQNGKNDQKDDKFGQFDLEDQNE